MVAPRDVIRRQFWCALTVLLCSALGIDAGAAQSNEQTLQQQAYAAYRARAIAASRARNEKVVADNTFEAGNLEQAAKLYLHALAVAPHAFYYNEKKEIATRLARANHKADAIALLEELLSELGSDEVAKLDITKLLNSLQPQAITSKEVDAMLKQDSRNKYALLTKADGLRQQKQFRESLAFYRRILQQGNDFDARLGLIYSLLAIGAKADAKQEFKQLSTEDSAQEEQHYELSNALDAGTRPRVDLLLNHYDDSDKNKSAEHGATIKVVVGNLDWIAEVRDKTATAVGYPEATPNTPVNITAKTKFYSLSAATNVTDRLLLTGKYGRIDLMTTDRSRSLNTGQLKLDVNTDTGVLSGNASWDVLNATTASIKNATQVAKKSIELTQALTDRLKTYLSYAYKSYSDGNAANDFRASASFVIYQGLPQISLGYGFHRTNYKNPLVDGEQPSYSYSAPQNLVAHQAMLTAYYESEQFYVNVDIEYGREAFEKNQSKANDQFRYNVVTIGFKATRKLSFELNKESSNSTIANAEDTYNESTLGARVSYLF